MAYEGQPESAARSYSPPTPAQPNDMQLWYHQICDGYDARCEPANSVPGRSSTKFTTGVKRSMPVMPCSCACLVVVVTSVGIDGSAACDMAVRALISF